MVTKNWFFLFEKKKKCCPSFLPYLLIPSLLLLSTSFFPFPLVPSFNFLPPLLSSSPHPSFSLNLPFALSFNLSLCSFLHTLFSLASFTHLVTLPLHPARIPFHPLPLSPSSSYLSATWKCPRLSSPFFVLPSNLKFFCIRFLSFLSSICIIIFLLPSVSSLTWTPPSPSLPLHFPTPPVSLSQPFLSSPFVSFLPSCSLPLPCFFYSLYPFPSPSFPIYLFPLLFLHLSSPLRFLCLFSLPFFLSLLSPLNLSSVPKLLVLLSLYPSFIPFNCFPIQS